MTYCDREDLDSINSIVNSSLNKILSLNKQASNCTIETDGSSEVVICKTRVINEAQNICHVVNANGKGN